MSDRRQGHLADPEVQARLKDLDYQVEEREAADLDAIMRTTEGRRFMYRMVFRVGGLQSPSYDTSGQAMSYREGRRAMALILLREAQAVCPELWIRMLQERMQRDLEDRQKRGNAMRLQGDNA